MKILAIETSDKTADLAILDTELDKVWEKQLKTVNKVSEAIILEIADLLNEAGTELKKLGAIAVGVGPGSYTGTRIGIATAKGLAQGLNIPVVGITSFEALIESVDENYEEKEIIPLIDAKNDRVYFQIETEQGCDNIQNVLKKLEDKDYVFVGTGADVHRSAIAEKFQEQATIADETQVHAKFIAQIADGRAQNNLFDNIISLKPLYINQPNIG